MVFKFNFRIFFGFLETIDIKLYFKLLFLIFNLKLVGKIRINNGSIVNEQTNDIINEITIIKPKSTIGFMSVMIKEPKATIVVSVVYRQGQIIFFRVTITHFSFSLAPARKIRSNVAEWLAALKE